MHQALASQPALWSCDMCYTCIAMIELMSSCLMAVFTSVFALAEVLLSLKGVTCPFQDSQRFK